jgi:aminoglycoside 6'-N-acetyltransferase I
MIVRINVGGIDDLTDWAGLRTMLWPDDDATSHRSDLIQFLARPGNAIGLLARDSEGTALGFAEAALRVDYVNGCDTSPVAFLEGLFVIEASRRLGVSRGLIEAVEAWARSKGCRELASDAMLDNTAAQAVHANLDFEETERVVYFRKLLDDAPALS